MFLSWIPMLFSAGQNRTAVPSIWKVAKKGLSSDKLSISYPVKRINSGSKSRKNKPEWWASEPAGLGNISLARRLSCLGRLRWIAAKHWEIQRETACGWGCSNQGDPWVMFSGIGVRLQERRIAMENQNGIEWVRWIRYLPNPPIPYLCHNM